MTPRELLQAKHEALRAYREATDDEARAIAWAGVDEASKNLDELLVDEEEARQDEQRLADIEARERAASIVADVVPEPKKTGLPVDEIRKFARGEMNSLKFTLDAPEQRTDMTTVDTTGYLK